MRLKKPGMSLDGPSIRSLLITTTSWQRTSAASLRSGPKRHRQRNEFKPRLASEPLTPKAYFCIRARGPSATVNMKLTSPGFTAMN
jgi:hypothetical protein